MRNKVTKSSKKSNWDQGWSRHKPTEVCQFEKYTRSKLLRVAGSRVSLKTWPNVAKRDQTWPNVTKRNQTWPNVTKLPFRLTFFLFEATWWFLKPRSELYTHWQNEQKLLHQTHQASLSRYLPNQSVSQNHMYLIDFDCQTLSEGAEQSICKTDLWSFWAKRFPFSASAHLVASHLGHWLSAGPVTGLEGSGRRAAWHICTSRIWIM